MKILSCLIAALTLGTFNAQASSDVRYPDRNSFFEFAWNYAHNADQYEEVQLTPHDLDKKTLQKLHHWADQNAIIWYDTVLEGDFQESDDALHLDEISALYDASGNLAAFHITYSRLAWATDSCEFDSEEFESKRKEDVLQNCPSGHIKESAFISPDLRYSEVDDNARADFEGN